MGKNNTTKSGSAQAQQVVEAEETVVATAPEPQVAATEETQVTEIVPAREVANALANPPLEDDGQTLLHLVPLLPHKESRLKKYRRPTEQEFHEAREQLGPASKEALDEMLERMSGEKEGVEDDVKTFRPFTIKIRQGANKDENRPELVDVGGLYTSDGRILTAPTDAQAKKNGVKTYQRMIVLSVWQGRVMFAPRVQGKTVPLQEFGDASTKVPYCQSMDRVRGRPVRPVPNVGNCATCPYQPWKVRGQPNLCQNQITAVVLLVRTDKSGEVVAFDGLYQIDFSKTSEPAGQFLYNAVQKARSASENILEIGTKEIKGDDGQGDYYIMDVRAVTDDDGRPMKTPPAAQAMIKVLYRKLQGDYFYPKLAYTYTAPRDAGPTGPSSDMNALERNAAIAVGGSPGGADMRHDNV